PQYRGASAHALTHYDAVTAVSESLRHQTIETFALTRTVDVIPNFCTPTAPTRSREEVRRDLGLTGEFLVLHMSNLRPSKRIDLLLRIIVKMKQRNRVRLLILAGSSFASCEPLLDELGIRQNVIVRTAAEPVESELQRNSPRKRQYRVTKQSIAECYWLSVSGSGFLCRYRDPSIYAIERGSKIVVRNRSQAVADHAGEDDRGGHAMFGNGAQGSSPISFSKTGNRGSARKSSKPAPILYSLIAATLAFSCSMPCAKQAKASS